MNAKEALKQLEFLGTAQNRKVYKRHGVTGKASGVSYANLGKLKKQIKVDHTLALALWKSGNHDARVLATMVVDPEQLDARTIDAWIKDCQNYVLTDALSGPIAKSAFARKRADKWIKARGEWVSTAGWNLVQRIAEDPEQYTEAELSGLLKIIESSIHTAPSRTRYSMNNALIVIGLRSAALRKAAIAAAKRIGAVEVDHGETGCRTPDAAAYIKKTVEHRKGKKKTASKKAKKRSKVSAR